MAASTSLTTLVDGEVTVWDKASGRERLRLHMPKDSGASDLTSLAWNPLFDGTLMFASTSRDGKLYIWTEGAVSQSRRGSQPGVEDSAGREKVEKESDIPRERETKATTATKVKDGFTSVSTMFKGGVKKIESTTKDGRNRLSQVLAAPFVGGDNSDRNAVMSSSSELGRAEKTSDENPFIAIDGSEGGLVKHSLDTPHTHTRDNDEGDITAEHIRFETPRGEAYGSAAGELNEKRNRTAAWTQ